MSINLSFLPSVAARWQRKGLTCRKIKQVFRFFPENKKESSQGVLKQPMRAFIVYFIVCYLNTSHAK